MKQKNFMLKVKDRVKKVNLFQGDSSENKFIESAFENTNY